MITRKINKIIVHCSDTKTNQNFTAKHIKDWHTKPKPNGNGWKDIGYHFIINLSGQIELGRDLNESGAHCYGHNADSIGVCFMGGKNPDGSKWEQPLQMQLEAFESLNDYLWFLFQKQLPIHAHSEFSSKSCPNFDIDKYLKL